MKKLVFSGILAAALICSTSVMAQTPTHATPAAPVKKEVAKAKTEAKAEVKKEEKKVESAVKTSKAKADKAKADVSTKTQKTK